MRRQRFRRIQLALIGLALHAAPLAGQTEGIAAPACVRVDLPADHWGTEAVRRLEALGVVSPQLPSAIVDACLLDSLLASADSLAPGSLGEMVEGWRALLAAEYAPFTGEAGVVAAHVHGSIRADDGAALPGRGEFAPERSGALAVDDRATPILSGVVAGGLGNRIWSAGGASVGEDGFAVERLELAAQLGPVELSLGRSETAYGIPRGGAVAFGRASRLDRVQLETRRPFRLPGALAAGGSFTFSTLFARLGPPRHTDEPYFWAAKGTWKPHGRLTFGITRAAMFGGDGVAITGRRLLDLLIGDVKGLGFENQVVSVEGLWRLPTEGVLPVTAYLEWGAEDAAGAWWDVPGRVLGLYVPAVPGAPSASLVVEYANFAESCCSNPKWYRHWSFPGSWVIEDEPLGHEVGGQGSEILIRMDAHTARATRRYVADVFTRTRGAENLFVPGREGRSIGGRFRAGWRAGRHLELSAAAAIEDGDGWTERNLRLGGTIFLLR